ncbi:hypothetical protein D3C73_1150400 [compost metagenome]
MFADRLDEATLARRFLLGIEKGQVDRRGLPVQPVARPALRVRDAEALGGGWPQRHIAGHAKGGLDGFSTGLDPVLVEERPHLGLITRFEIHTFQRGLKKHLHAPPLGIAPGPATVAGQQHRHAHFFGKGRVEVEDDAAAHHVRLHAAGIEDQVHAQRLLVFLANLPGRVEIQPLALAFHGVDIGRDHLERGGKVRPVPVASPKHELRGHGRAAAARDLGQATAFIDADDPLRRPGAGRPDDKKQEKD